MNTFRNILYAGYSLFRLTGIKFYKDRRFLICAAGDDGICLLKSLKWAKTFHNAMLKATSRDKYSDSPLGQCIDPDELKISTIDEMSFCSKWFFTSGGQLIITRDCRKVLM